MDFPNCIEFELTKTGLASDAHEIPHEPETVWRVPKYGVTVSMAQETYPVGTDSIAVFLENDSDGNAMYGESFSLKKYIDGQWEDVSGNLAFNAVGYDLENHCCKVMQYSTGVDHLPAPLGVGLYRITGSDIRYTPVGGHVGYDAVHSNLGNFTVEFTVTEDAPEPASSEALEQEAENRLWYSSYTLIDPYFTDSECGGSSALNGPYMAAYWMKDQQLHLMILDRSTGETLLPEPYSFDADFYAGDLIVLRDKTILIRTEADVYQIQVQNGNVLLQGGAQFPDEDIPYEPISETAAMDYDLTAAMEQAWYPAGTETVAFTMTNHSSADLTLEVSSPMYTLFRINYQSGGQNCWYDQANSDATSIEPEKEKLTIPAGQTVRVEIPLAL